MANSHPTYDKNRNPLLRDNITIPPDPHTEEGTKWGQSFAEEHGHAWWAFVGVTPSPAHLGKSWIEQFKKARWIKNAE